MKLLVLLTVCLLMILCVPAAWAQDGGVVVESVDEDIVEDAAVPAPPVVDEQGAAADTGIVDTDVTADDAPAQTGSNIDHIRAVFSDGDDIPARSGLDIDALLSEDDEDDLLIGDKPVIEHAEADSSSVDSLSTPSGKTADRASDDVEGRPVAAAPAGTPAPEHADVAAADDGPVVIEDGRTINFAQNLKDYKSPRFAMLLSLLVPGLGQAYSRNYVKASAFGAAELAAIGVAVYLNSAGNSRKRKAYRFADQHFDTTKLRDYGDRLYQEFKNRELIDHLTIDFPPYESYDTSFWNAARGRQSYFYESIRDGYFTPGWKDNEPDLEHILTASANENNEVGGGPYNQGTYALADPGNQMRFYFIRLVADASGRAINGPTIIGYSSRQSEYNSMMKDAKSYHDAANYTLYALILNHIASAIDAGFTARAHNARLLGENHSVWNRLSVEQQYVFTGSEMTPGIALRVRF